jgi:hypothetical protein
VDLMGNAIDVMANVRAVFPQIQEQLPAGLHGKVVADLTEFITESISEVMKTLIEAMVIVVIVIYLFLGSFRSVFIPIVAIPLSIVGSCALMLALGFSINLLTLLAMVLAIGLVVDDAIVVVENIHRHIEEGLTPMAAAQVARHFKALGGDARLRAGVVTDNGNHLLDVHGLQITDPLAMECEVNQWPGVVTVGIFARHKAKVCLLGTPAGVRRMSF